MPKKHLQDIGIGVFPGRQAHPGRMLLAAWHPRNAEASFSLSWRWDLRFHQKQSSKKSPKGLLEGTRLRNLRIEVFRDALTALSFYGRTKWCKYPRVRSLVLNFNIVV